MGDSGKHPVLLLTRKFDESTTSRNDANNGNDIEAPSEKQQHSKLTKSILKLSKNQDKRKLNSEQRTEYATKVSEYAFKGGKDVKLKVDIRDLSRSLTLNKKSVEAKKKKIQDGATVESSKKGNDDDDDDAKRSSSASQDDKPVKRDKKGEVVHREARNLKARQPTRAPLVKHKEEKLLRQVGYNIAVDEVKKWKGVVKRNREAETVSFPLEQPSFNVSSTQELVKRFKPRTPLELEVAKLLNGSESVLGQDRILTVREERALKAMDLEEAKRKRAELQKMRSLQSYAQVRSKRQGKIKSKRYHRRVRKEKEGENAKIYEELEKSHPERFQDMLEKMEKKRVEERMNQRHKNNSKWVKSMMKLGKKDSEARTALNEALETSRKLTEKRQIAPSDDENEDGGNEKNDVDVLSAITDGATIVDLANNPWLSGTKGKKDLDVAEEKTNEESISSMYPKLKEIRNEESSEDDEDEDDDEDDSEEGDEEDETRDADDLPDVIHEDDDDVLAEKEDRIIERIDASATSNAASTSGAKTQEVDPTKILLAPETSSSGRLPTLASYENEIDGDDEARVRLTIEEAFADDDVVAEFAATKAVVVDKQTAKPICTALPGWGDWVGGALSGVSAKRKRHFTVKPEKTAPRRDAKNPRVIINEKQKRNPKIARHQVSDLPTRDFDSVEQFEKSIRAPVGRMWNAEAAYQKMIVPDVTTKMGTVIDPISKEKTFVREKEEAHSGDDDEEEEKEKSDKKKMIKKRKMRDEGKSGKVAKKKRTQ